MGARLQTRPACPPPSARGAHPPVTYLLTRGEHQTVPVLTIDGRSIGDSTAVIAELEARFPEPRLYPDDPDERHRALELEEWFDEQLGPYIRRWAYHEILSDPEAVVELAYKQVPTARPSTIGFTTRVLKFFLDARFGVRSEEKARRAEEKVMQALDRLEEELEGREFLCGDAFSVADLTAASLFYPLALPPEGPWTPRRIPPAWEERTGALRDRPGCRWIAQTYARHRLSGARSEEASRASIAATPA